jgi:hypothetical protein
LQFKKTTVEHTWTIDDFRLCLGGDGEQRSSVFSIGAMNCLMLLYRNDYYVNDVERQYFGFKLEPVNKTDENTNEFEQKRAAWKLFVQEGNYKGIIFEF